MASAAISHPCNPLGNTGSKRHVQTGPCAVVPRAHHSCVSRSNPAQDECGEPREGNGVGARRDGLCQEAGVRRSLEEYLHDLHSQCHFLPSQYPNFNWPSVEATMYTYRTVCSSSPHSIPPAQDPVTNAGHVNERLEEGAHVRAQRNMQQPSGQNAVRQWLDSVPPTHTGAPSDHLTSFHISSSTAPSRKAESGPSFHMCTGVWARWWCCCRRAERKQSKK